MKIRVLSATIGPATAIVALLALASPVGAAITHCFSPPEVEAQEAVRYQAKLMVISDTCHSETYRRFTVRNRAEIVRYQDELVEHYRRTGSRHAEQSFDSFLTGQANEISLSTGREPLASLCSEAADFLSQADQLDQAHFPHFITSLAAERRNDYLRCGR